jgi:hypothetical protein
LDEPSQTNLPSAWVKDVENPQTIEVLFYLARVTLQKMPFDQNQRLKAIAQMAFRCLSEYANVRATYFTDKNSKN